MSFNLQRHLSLFLKPKTNIKFNHKHASFSTISRIASDKNATSSATTAMSNYSKTFENQSLLPKLPIPSLESTISRYLRSVQPLQTQQEHEHTKKLAHEFFTSLGPKLQERLNNYAATQPNSWLEVWWLMLAYHSWRESVLVHSNWYMLLENHPAHPSDLFDDTQLWKRQRVFTDFQLKRAGNLISLLVKYLDQLTNEQIPPESTKQGPLCMNQYKYLFGITRVPLEGCDKIVGSFPPTSQHVLVLARDQIFPLKIVENGQVLNTQEITLQLTKIAHKVTRPSFSSQPPIPILTGEHRDRWAKNYAYLSLLGQNKNNFKIIESALFTVCLDDIAITKDVDAFAKRTFSGIQGQNRWYDTCLSMLVQNDGRVSVNGEHSPLDALIPAYVFNTIVSRESADDFKKQYIVRSSGLSEPKCLEWTVDTKVHEFIAEAQKNVNETVNDSDLKILEFYGFGTEFIKKLKVSPDAFVQMALQLTFYRLHRELTAVYETASTRKFLHGRTETTRSLSEESKAFVTSFDDPHTSDETKFKLFKQACKSHVDYLIAASNGEGCDRHLLGLSMCLEKGESSPFFKDPVYSASKNFRLSTSNLFPGKHLVATGFGCVVPNGYGMNYMIHPDHIRIGIESKFSCKETSSSAFAETLIACWNEMKLKFEQFGALSSKL